MWCRRKREWGGGHPQSVEASRPRRGDPSSPEDGEVNGVEQSAFFIFPFIPIGEGGSPLLGAVSSGKWQVDRIVGPLTPAVARMRKPMKKEEYRRDHKKGGKLGFTRSREDTTNQQPAASVSLRAMSSGGRAQVRGTSCGNGNAPICHPFRVWLICDQIPEVCDLRLRSVNPSGWLRVGASQPAVCTIIASQTSQHPEGMPDRSRGLSKAIPPGRRSQEPHPEGMPERCHTVSQNRFSKSLQLSTAPRTGVQVIIQNSAFITRPTPLYSAVETHPCRRYRNASMCSRSVWRLSFRHRLANAEKVTVKVAECSTLSAQARGRLRIVANEVCYLLDDNSLQLLRHAAVFRANENHKRNPNCQLPGYIARAIPSLPTYGAVSALPLSRAESPARNGPAVFAQASASG